MTDEGDSTLPQGSLRVLLFGLTGFGNAALGALRAEGCAVPAVITRSEPGPHPHYQEVPIQEEARGWGIPVYEDVSFKEASAHKLVKGLAPDLILCSSYHEVIPRRVLDLAPLGGVNVHPSLLPRYRGPTPTNWSLIFGEEKTGVTLHVLTNQLDAGDILLQRVYTIAPNETNGEVRKELARLSGEMIRELIGMLKRGESPSRTPQAGGDVTYFPRVMERDGHIEFNEPSRNVHNRIRGMSPYPGAFTWNGEKKVRILRSEIVSQDSHEVAPGLLLCAKKGLLDVKTKDGIIRLEIHPEDRVQPSNSSHLILGPSREKSVASAMRGDSLIVHTRERYGIEPGAEEFPKMVVLSVAYPCNAKCPHCPYTETNSDIRKKYADAPYIAPALFKKIADECGEYASFLRITGGGEPMMHPHDMARLIEYAKGAGARIWLNTNGSLFTEENMNRLLACGTDLIECSVDAADPDTYAIVRAGLDWDNLLRSVCYLLRRRNETEGPSRIVVSVINQHIVKDKMDEIADFWLKQVGVDEVLRRKFLTWGSNTTIDPTRSGDPSAYLDKFEGEPCPYPFHRLNIDSRGKVEVCGYDISGRTNFGNIWEKSIREIWKGPMFEWWRQMHADRRGGDIPLCRECPDWQYRSWNHNWEKVLKTTSERRDLAHFSGPSNTKGCEPADTLEHSDRITLEPQTGP